MIAKDVDLCFLIITEYCRSLLPCSNVLLVFAEGKVRSCSTKVLLSYKVNIDSCPFKISSG